MLIDDTDDDLFDAPVRTKKPSNRIVHQPAGASWSLDRLPEIETFYQQTFKKRLPLTNRGQGSIHNKWNYDHTNSADVSLNPSSSEGRQFEAKLREMGVPFLAFTGAIPGVATGPHYHLGFPSRKTDKKFNIGAQRKKQSVASDDLFDADSDLFDQVQGQTPPPQTPRNAGRSRQPSPSPQVVQKASSVPANRLSQLAVGGAEGRSSTLGVGDLRRLDDPVTQQINRIQRGVTSEQSPAERQLKRAPGTANARLLDPKLTENEEVLRRLSEEQDAEKRQKAVLAEQKRLMAQFTPEDKAEIADFVNHLKGKGTTYTGIRAGARSVGASALYKLAGLTDLVGPSQVYGGKPEDNPLGEFLRRKALAGELSVDEIPPEQRGQVAEFLTQMGLGLAEIAVTPGGPVTKFAGLAGTESVGRGQSAKDVAKETAKGATIGQVFKSAGKTSRPAETVRGRVANLTREGAAIGAGTYATEKGFGAPTDEAALSAATNVVLHGALGARRLRGQRDVEAPDRANEAVRPLRATAEEAVPPTVEGVGARPSELERIQGARQAEAQHQGVSPEQPVEAVEGQPVVSKTEAPQKYQHLQFGEVEVVPDQSGARPGRIKVAEVADPTKQHFVKKADMRGRGNERMVPIKEPSLSIEGEVGGAGERGALDKPAPNIPERPETIQAQLESRGYSLIPKDTPRPSLPQGYRAEKTHDGVVYYDPKRIDAETIRSTPTTELLGHVEPKSERTTEAVVARTPEGTELHSSAVSPENLAKQVEVTKANFPEAKIEAGKGVAEKVLEERVDWERAKMDYGRGFNEVDYRAETWPIERIKQTEFPAESDVQPRLNELKQEIKDGTVRPILVHEETKSVINGNHRLKAFQQLGVKDVPVLVVKKGAGTGRVEQRSSAEPSTTSARKETMSADRAELDLPQLPQAERKSWQSTLDKAKEKGTQRASILADEVLNSPRSLNDVETAQLVLRAQEIKNDHARVMKEIGNETNPESIQAKRAEVEALEREFDKLTQATKASGTEKGRALASQKLTINQDYDLVSLVQRAKAAKGRELTPEERTRYEGMAKEIESLTERLSKAEEELTSKRLQKEIDRVVRRGKRAETKKQLDDEFAMLARQFAQARAQSRGIHSAGLAGLDPEGIYTPLIAKMAKNRIRAGVVKAEEVVDHVYEALDGAFSKRDIRDAISGYRLERKGKPRSEDVKELARVKSELRKLSAQEDIETGKRLSPAEKTRQTNLLKQEADLQRRLEEKDFDRPERRTLRYSRETQALESRVSKLKAQYERELYLAQRGKLGAAWDVAVNVANVPKSLKSMGDVSAILRQGGFFSFTHPILSTKAGIDMLRSFSETGFKNVEREITSHRDFDLAKRSGVEFTGMEKDNPNLSKREEAYLGGDIIDRATEIPVAGKVVKPVKAVKDFSERTFVSFLDSQRMQVFSRFADHIRSLKMSPKEEAKAMKAMANFVNVGTGRGSLGKSGNQIAPALNVMMFSPRLLASRVQLMNKMVNPVAIKRMPKGARSLMIKDNLKFAGTIATALGLAKAAGAGVSLDPDDADFLKIRIGNSRYDILTGLQQPMRFIYRMARAVQADATGSETYAGEGKGALIERFARSKAAPLAGGVADYISGEDFKGRKFKLSRQLVDLVTPLYLNDFKEAMEEDGVAGALVKTSPALIGIGAQTYKDAPEKAHTHAEKLARKFVRAKMPDNAREEEQIDIDQTKADLKAKSRRGEDVTKELEALGAKITSKQAKGILDARNKTRLQENVNRLSALDAIIVWSVMNPGQQQETRSILERKASLIDNLPIDQQENVRRRYQEAGIQGVTRKPSTRATGFKKAFQRQFATAP